MLYLKHKVAVVTGASRGIGRSIAVTLAQNGYDVVVNYKSSEEAAQDTLETVNNYSSGILIRADISKVEEVNEMCHIIQNKYGYIDVLINNAGAIFRPGKWDLITDEFWDLTYQVNAKGVYNCIRAMIPLFSPNSIGHIINIASTVGEAGGAGVISYGAAKAAVINMTYAFAKEFAPNIVVNAVSPGNIDTDMTRGANEEFVRKTIERTPMKRLGKAQEVADLVCFLSSEKANFITGQVIDIDGGYSCRT